MTGSSPGHIGSNECKHYQHLESVLSLLTEALLRLDELDLCPAFGARLNDVIIGLEAQRNRASEPAQEDERLCTLPA